MKRLWVYILFSLVLLAAILWGVNRLTGVFNGATAIFRSSTSISAVTLKDIAPTMQLRTLTIQKELLVSQYRQNPWYQGDDEIHVVYPGRIDLGFDLSRCGDDWLQVVGDSTLVHMPAVEILNAKSNYTGLADVKIEVGKWQPDDMNRLHDRANAMMLRSCEAEDCYRRAEELGAKALTDLLSSFGYHNITVSIDHRDSYGSYTFSGDEQAFQYWAEGPARYLKFRDGSQLLYDGLGEYELLAFADLFRSYLEAVHSSQFIVHSSSTSEAAKPSAQPNAQISTLKTQTSNSTAPRTQVVVRRGNQLQFSFIDAPWTTDNAKAALTPYHQTIRKHIAGRNDQVSVELLDKNRRPLYRLR